MSDEYAALLQDDEGPTLSHTGAKEMAAPLPRSALRLERIVRIATAIIVCCTVIDMLLILYLGIHQFTTNHSPPVEADGDDLEIRSPFVNLAELYSQETMQSSKHDPIVNHARAFVQISSTEPERIFPPWGLMRLTPDGMVPEYKRHLLVTPTTSTVAQFRVADFGMESCSLSITLPPLNETDGFVLNEPATLDIWSWDVPKKMEMHKLSWATRYPRKTFLGSLPVSIGETNRLPGYRCLSGSYQTLEFTCSTPNCKIDITGEGDHASGLYMYQYQTI
ncbi:hypothetical protein C8J57DRAFT_1497508 [Mycena rebaudengoi]|nr:hypothetical protein C8J57DRAFT_1497508 [Mycena rebaudengoi]